MYVDVERSYIPGEERVLLLVFSYISLVFMVKSNFLTKKSYFLPHDKLRG
jgi:hypothetical protein